MKRFMVGEIIEVVDNDGEPEMLSKDQMLIICLLYKLYSLVELNTKEET
jgi:hypothetical protein